MNWTSSRIGDPDGDFEWVAVDTFPDEASALADVGTPEAKVTGREWMFLRPGDEDDENDAYLMEEYGLTHIAEPCDESHEGAREFWAVQRYPFPDDDGRPLAGDLGPLGGAL